MNETFLKDINTSDDKKMINDYILNYKQHLAEGDIQVTYEGLIKYVMTLKSKFSHEFEKKYQTGNVSPGYMDFTYFPFSNDDLRIKKLRFGIVLNHKEMRFELWLMGRNAKVQRAYWDILKTTEWNKKQEEMPKYSVLEAILVEKPDFNNLDLLTKTILKKAETVSEEVSDYLSCFEK